MIDKALLYWLRKTGKKDLASFVEGLLHAGRPSAVRFPPELMEQGVSLVMAGLDNTLSFQSNADWIWPFWYERQRDARSPCFVPTGMNMVTTNMTLRNWTSVGLPGSELESVVDPAGMLTLRPYGCSVFPYVRLQGESYFPPLLTEGVSQCLLEEIWPAVVTQYHVDAGLGWKSTVCPIGIGSEELVAFTHELENRTREPLELTFGLAIRPYNALNVAHVRKIKFSDQLWRVNREALLWVLEEPSWCTARDSLGKDPLREDTRGASRFSLSSRSGIACGQCEFDLVLEPGEKHVLESVGTLRSGHGRPFPYFNRPSFTEVQEGKERAKAKWERQSRRGMQLCLPARKWQTAFTAVRNRLYVFDDQDHFSPGTYVYHSHWVRDSAYICMAYAALGWTEELKPKLEGMLSLQTADGFFRSQNGEWDSNGQAIWSLVEYAIIGDDPAFLKGSWPALMKACRWIDRKRKEDKGADSSHRGLLPAGLSAEHFGPNDHYYWDNFWGLSGLRACLTVAERFGFAEEGWLKGAHDSYAGDLRASVEGACKRNGQKGLPASPYRRVDCAAIGNMVALSPLELWPSETLWIRETAETLWAEHVCQDMFFQRIIHSGLNAYLTLQLARAFLLMDDPRWETLLEGVLTHATPTWTWPEAIHPSTQGGCMGDGDHGWAAAELVSFLASLMARVQEGALYLGRGIPRRWYRPGERFGAKDCSTRAGHVSWEVQCHGQGATLSWEIRRHASQLRLPCYFQLPRPLGLSQPYLTDNEDSRRFLRLEGDSGSYELRIS